MKEHCKTCDHNSKEDGDGINPFCSYHMEPIEDEENETCFDWDMIEQLTEEY